MPPSSTGRRPYRPHDELPGAESDQKRRQHKLETVCERNVKGSPDIGQRRQHHVHRERVQRHDGGNHDHEFGKTHRAVSRGYPTVGIDLGHGRFTSALQRLFYWACSGAQPAFWNGC